MYIQYIVSCIKDKHVLKSKSTKVLIPPKFISCLDSWEGGFKNSNCLKMGAVEKILPLDVSPQTPPPLYNK